MLLSTTTPGVVVEEVEWFIWAGREPFNIVRRWCIIIK